MAIDSGRLRYLREQMGVQLAALLGTESLVEQEWDDEADRLVETALDLATRLLDAFERRHPEMTRDQHWTGR